MSVSETIRLEKMINQLRANFVDKNGCLDNKIMNRFNEIKYNLRSLGYTITYDVPTNELRIVCCR